MKPDTAIFTAFEDFLAFDDSEPEKNLMRAVLRSAMEDICKSGSAQRDARNYFLSRDENYLYSFTNVCNHLNLCQRTVLTICGLVEQEKGELNPHATANPSEGNFDTRLSEENGNGLRKAEQ